MGQKLLVHGAWSAVSVNAFKQECAGSARLATRGASQLALAPPVWRVPRQGLRQPGCARRPALRMRLRASLARGPSRLPVPRCRNLVSLAASCMLLRRADCESWNLQHLPVICCALQAQDISMPSTYSSALASVTALLFTMALCLFVVFELNPANTVTMPRSEDRVSFHYSSHRFNDRSLACYRIVQVLRVDARQLPAGLSDERHILGSVADRAVLLGRRGRRRERTTPILSSAVSDAGDYPANVRSGIVRYRTKIHQPNRPRAKQVAKEAVESAPQAEEYLYSRPDGRRDARWLAQHPRGRARDDLRAIEQYLELRATEDRVQKARRLRKTGRRLTRSHSFWYRSFFWCLLRTFLASTNSHGIFKVNSR